MVIFNITDYPQNLLIPLPRPYPADNVSLQARNTTDNQVVAFPIVNWEMQGFLLRVVLEVPEVFHAGEWEYELAYVDENGEVVKGNGLLIGVEKREDAPVQYEAETKYKQYGE